MITGLAAPLPLAPQALPASSTPVPVATASSTAANDSVTISTAPSEGPRLSALGKGLRAVGNGLARLGLMGGIAVGAGLGLGAGLLLGGVGLALPVMGAAMLGFEAADARSAKQALAQGTSSPAFLDRAQRHRTLTHLAAASHVATVAGGLTAFGAGLGLVGGVPGLMVGVAGTLAAAGAVLFATSKAEKAVLQGA